MSLLRIRYQRLWLSSFSPITFSREIWLSWSLSKWTKVLHGKEAVKHKFKFRLQDFKAQVINHYYTFFTQNLQEPKIHVLLLSNNSQTPTPLLCMSQCIFHFLSKTAWDLLYHKSSFGVSQKKKKKSMVTLIFIFIVSHALPKYFVSFLYACCCCCC